MSTIHGWMIIFCLFALITAILIFYYLYFFRRLATFKPEKKLVSQQHPVSVVICARDEAANLTKNLPGVLVQEYNSTREVIVVNDNSSDESKYLLDELKRTFKQLNAVELYQEAKLIPGKKYPLSIGIKEARHEVLLLTDADCVPASEKWMELMQDGYYEGTEIVLGYGAYHKKKGFLNKLIRFETFHTALQYLSYALAGMPYMGVGRNLSYKKGLFFTNKGFSSINNIPGGDDDLFINKVANKRNTRIVIDQGAFTLSEPKKKWKDWLRQKTRHYSTSRYYKPKHKFFLGLYSISQFLFYPLFVASLLVFDWQIVLGVFLFKTLIQSVIYYKAMKKLNEADLFPWFIIFDIWMFFYYIIFTPALYKKTSDKW